MSILCIDAIYLLNKACCQVKPQYCRSQINVKCFSSFRLVLTVSLHYGRGILLESLSGLSRGNNPPAPPRDRRFIDLPLRPKLAKGKKDKIQKSRGNPDTAEAYSVVAVGRTAAAPRGNGAADGIVDPATAALHTVRPATCSRRIIL